MVFLKEYNSESMARRYYSKLQQRFVSSGEYFDELLFGTLEAPFDKPFTNKIKKELDNNINNN